MLQRDHSTWLFLLVLLLTSVATAQKLFVVLFFNSVGTPQLHRRKFTFPNPDANGFRMHAQVFGYLIDCQPLLWHKFSLLAPFVARFLTL